MKQLHPVRVRLFVGAVAGLAAASALLTSVVTGGSHEPSTALSVVFVALIAVTDRLAIRFDHRASAENLVPLEGLLAPLIFSASGTRTVVIVVIGVVLAQILNRNTPLKVLFNVSQWVIAVCAGVGVWHGLGLAHDGQFVPLGGLALSLSAVVVVNQILITGVLWCATGHPLGTPSARGTSHVINGRLISCGFNAVLGVLTTAVYFWQPWALLIVFAPLVMLHFAGRAEASMYGSQQRLLALQRAGHHLTSSLDRSALQPFLDEVRDGFDVEEIQLVLFGDRTQPPVVYVATSDAVPSPHAIDLADEVAATMTQPRHIDDRSGGEVAGLLKLLGRRRALVAPLTNAVGTVGVLMLFDRLGVEGFETGELTIAGALARELVGFIQRVDLVAAIEDERRKLADVVDHTSDGIISIAHDGTILSWNAAMAEMTGYAAHEMVGTRHLGLLRPRDAAGENLYPDEWMHRKAAQGLAAEMQITAASGNTVWLSCSYSVIPAGEGGRDVLIGVGRNVTRARELELLKDDFVAVVSHELRTPLVPIKGWAQTLLTRGDRLSPEQRATAVQSILSQAQRLESLVLNILESSRVEAGRNGATDIVDVAAIAVHIAEDTLAARPDRVVRVRPPTLPCHVRGSAVWVERAMSNLVANAIKYSPDDQPVDVLVSCQHGVVSVSVTDRGPGIPQDAQDRIFARFERLEQSRKQTGTGLGLYITRRLARGMGGDVTVSSLPGAGSTFVLSLPAVADSAPATPVLPAPRAALASTESLRV